MKKDKSKIDKFGMTKMEHFKEYMYMYGWAVIALVVVFGVLWDMGLFKNEAVIEEPYIPEEIEQKEMIEVCSEFTAINRTKIIYLTEHRCHFCQYQYTNIGIAFIKADNTTRYANRETYSFNDTEDKNHLDQEYLRGRCYECLATTEHIIYNWTEDICTRYIFVEE